MKYQSFVGYYRAIRQHNHAQAIAQRTGKTPVSTSANVNAITSVAMPDNQREIVLDADSAMMNVTLENLTDYKRFKAAFVVFCVILNNAYRNAIKAQRKKSINAMRPQGGKSNETENEVSSTAGQQARTAKVTREQCIPEYFNACSSEVAKAAVVLQCANGIRGVTKRTVLYHALAGQIGNVSMAVKLVTQIKQNPSALKNEAEISPSEEAYPILVQTLLELAELTRDKSPAKLAVIINEPVYLLATRHLFQRGVLDSVFPFEPLIARYLHDCVAPINVAREQVTIYNQFKLDPGRTMEYLLNAIPKKNDKTGNATPRTNGSSKFDDDEIYEVFVGPLNYIHNVMITYVPHEGRNYRTITYNDCLYDVVGCSVDRTHDGTISRDSTLCDNLRWSERLALIPYRAKIKLERMSGADLNAFRGNACLQVSWMEDKRERSKLCTFKNGSASALSPTVKLEMCEETGEQLQENENPSTNASDVAVGILNGDDITIE